MSTLLVLVLTAGPVLAVALVSAFPASARPQAPAPGRLGAVARTTGRWRWAGLAAGVALAGYALTHDRLGRGLALAAPLLGLGVVLGVVAGELRVAAPRGVTRVAVLEVRRVRDYLPRVLTPVVAAATLALLGLLAFASAVASPDDLGRPGRALTTTCPVTTDGALATTSSTGPWPGSFYAVPLGAAVTGGLIAAAVALASITRRPRQGEDQPLDDALRRHAGGAVVAAVGVLVGVPLAGVSAAAASAVQSSPCLPGGWRVLGVGLAVLAACALAATAWSATVLLRGTRAGVAAPDPVGVAG